MNLKIEVRNSILERGVKWFEKAVSLRSLVAFSLVVAVLATTFFFLRGDIIRYGDAESHLNIAKRVVSGLTPGLAQLGGIWLPLPHIFMVPFVYFDVLWRTGLAGSIVSGIAFIITSVFIYKTIFTLTRSVYASFAGYLAFVLNPNILYLQATPMTELTLLMFFVLSTYFFIQYLEKSNEMYSLILAALFGFCATLSRYDGWFLVLIEAGIIVLKYFPYKRVYKEMEGKVVLFSTLAFFGVLIWFMWGFLILGDPLYFTHSQFSANSQQQNWLSRGELPAYHNLPIAVLYYFITGMSNIGVMVTFIFIFGLVYFLTKVSDKAKWYIALILLAPFIFNVTTLFIGQSVIFIPHVTPVSFEWRLFNVRYGVMMIPAAAIFLGYLFKVVSVQGKLLIIGLCIFQVALFGVGYSQVISLQDGLTGLSSAKRPDAEYWMAKHYDKGLVLMDDYARTISIIRSTIPMQASIYIGNKPYWEESLKEPEKYATWIIMQKDDAVWKALYDNKIQQARLYKYFQKAYTSKEILIFRRTNLK